MDIPKIAPPFSLPDQEGIVRSLADYKGSWLLLYFYPKDDTPGCTKEACSFRDMGEEYAKMNISIMGVSKDTITSHKTFAKKYHLTFPLLSNESADICKTYGAWEEKKLLGKTFGGVKRISFLIDPDQTIQKEYLNVNVFTHATEILKDTKRLREEG